MLEFCYGYSVSGTNVIRMKLAMSQLNQPVVSIVIPVFNGRNFIKEAIDSVLAQTYSNIELIVLDDGSTDGTFEIVNSYSKNLFFRQKQENIGQAATLNKGWELAKGQILSYLSADDVLLPNAVEDAVLALKQNSLAVMVYGDYELIDISSKRIKTVNTKEFDYKELLIDIIVQPGPGPFFYKKCLERSGGWNVSLRQVPDYDFWLRLGLLGQFVRIPKTLAQFRIHEESQSYNSTSVSKSDEIIHVVKDFFKNDSMSQELRANKAKAIAMSYLVAARFHLRAKRFRSYFQRSFSAMRYHWQVLFNYRAWQLNINAWMHVLSRFLNGR